MEVLALGLSRSGTDSLRTALAILGYKNPYHAFASVPRPEDWVIWCELASRKFESEDPAVKTITAADFDRAIGDCTAITDIPCVPFAPELVAAYPEARVILNTRRSVEAWHSSWLATIQPWHDSWQRYFLSFFEKESYWLVRGFHLVNMNYYRYNFRASGRYVYAEHNAMVRGLMKGREGEFLEWSVEDGWEPLCEFLGKPVPDVPFPSANAGAEFAERVVEVMARRDQKAWRNLSVFAVGVLSVAGVAAHKLTPREWLRSARELIGY